MYFYGRKFLWKAEDQPKQAAIAAMFPETRGAEITKIEAEFKYWRKANQIHHFFVTHAQNGVDECQETEIDPKLLYQLRDTCAAVLASPDQAHVLLPRSSGFFFGATEYDDWYFDQVKETHNWLNDFLLKEAFEVLKGWEFYYRSSW